MKPKLMREFALISLPLILIGGAAWLFAGQGRSLLPARFDNGPARLEFSPFEEVELKPLEIYDGYDWATQSEVNVRGKWGDLPGLKAVGGSSPTAQMRLIYRVGKSWKQAPRVDSNKISVTNQIIGGRQLGFRVNLETIPPNAEEVRLRGHFEAENYYKGTLPAGWKPPKNLRSFGLNHLLTLQSKPFDLIIKTPNQPLPAPHASRAPELEFVAAGWYYRPNVNDLYVRLRATENRGSSQEWKDLTAISLSMRDAKGKEITFVDSYGAKLTISGWKYLDRANYPTLPSNEAVYEIAYGEPSQGWPAVEQPITVDAQLSDGTAWPSHIRATMKQQNGDYQSLAQLPAK